MHARLENAYPVVIILFGVSDFPGLYSVCLRRFEFRRCKKKQADGSLSHRQQFSVPFHLCQKFAEPAGRREPKGGFMKQFISPKPHSSCLSHCSAARGSPHRRGKGAVAAALLLAGLAAAPLAAWAQKSNPVCPTETAFYNPGHAEDIVVPKGYKVEVFARDLNFPTDVAFVGDKHSFKVVVLESGTGLPSRCNNNELVPGVPRFAANNPFTPDVLIFDQNGNKVGGPLGKPTAGGGD